RRRDVDQVEQQSGSLQVLEESDPEARALCGALDQPRDVGHHEALVRSDVHHAQVRMQCGEGIVRDTWSRRRDSADQRRLPRVWQAEEPHVREQFQLESQLALLPRMPLGRLARRAVRAALEPLVAKTALAAESDQHACGGLREVAQLFLGVHVVERRAHRYYDFPVCAALAAAVAAAAGLAVARLEAALVPKVRERIEPGVRDDIYAAAVTAVAAVRAAKGHELFAAKAHLAPTTVAGLDLDARFVHELHRSPRENSSGKKPETKRPRETGASLLVDCAASALRLDAHVHALGDTLALETHHALRQREQ